MNYYNEIDPFAASWLYDLMKAGHIPVGIIDTRSIEDIQPNDLQGFTQCHFFAGIGVWSYALRCAEWPEDRPVWTGSCPCQPFSAAGKRTGTDDERHLWPAFFHLIEQCRPPVVFGEQVASKDGLAWLDTVSTDLEGAGYTFGASDLCAAGVGAPHIRQRLYFMADAEHPERRAELQEFPEAYGRDGSGGSGKSRVVTRLEGHSGDGERRKVSTGSTAETGNTGQLNPALSRWLMGLPTEWASCGAMVTRLSRRSRKFSSVQLRRS